MKAVLLSIRPEWVKKILDEEKTVEIRKTIPKVETPFKCYIYCAHSKNGIAYCKGNDMLNGKVVAEFICDRIFPIRVFNNGTIQDWNFNNLKDSCVSYDDIVMYIGNNRNGYGWHISDLVIYDKPKGLAEFRHTDEHITKAMNSVAHWECGIDDEIAAEIRRPPQSWCYVEAKEA